MNLLDVWSRANVRTRPNQAADDALVICNLIKRFPLNRKDAPNLRRHIQRERPRTTEIAVQTISNYGGASLSGKSHKDLYKAASAFLSAGSLPDAIKVIDQDFAGLSFDRDKQEESIWHTAPPLLQLAEIAESEGYDADELIDRIETAKMQIQRIPRHRRCHTRRHSLASVERPLHLMTAWRAKGKEFDTVILLDTVEGIWPDYRANEQRELEAARRLFYVAFTRAQRRVIMLTETGAAVSPFVDELGLPG